MTEKLSRSKEETLKQLIRDHNLLCEFFDKEVHEIMDEINQICEPAGIIAHRISTFKGGKEVTRIHLASKPSMEDIEIDEEWLKMLYDEDSRM